MKLVFLKKAPILGFLPATNLLCLVLIKRYGIDTEFFKKELSQHTKKVDELISSFTIIINRLELNIPYIFNVILRFYRNVYFVYNLQLLPVLESNILEEEACNEITNTRKIFNINQNFYEGFGNDI